MLVVFFVLLFTSRNLNARSAELIKIPASSAQQDEPDSYINYVQEKTAIQFPNGIVRYYIDPESYDNIITSRIRAVMDTIEASSCVVFNQMELITDNTGSWVHFTNADKERDCVHERMQGNDGEIKVVIGYDCMSTRNLLHSVLHALGFRDEVSHPHRDQYIRVMWENIQPVYRPLFRIQLEDEPYKLVEYDPLSVMHFHDRAYTSNGGPTIMPRMPGLLIASSETLSQLDVMKLRLWFGHECNKRKVGDLVKKCKNVFYNKQMELKGCSSESEGIFDESESEEEEEEEEEEDYDYATDSD